MANLSYLGKGELYPLTPDSAGGVSLIDEGPLVRQSLGIIFRTPKGTQFPNEHFGCDINLLTFTQNDAIIESLGIYYLSEAAFLWEKRCRITSITATQENINLTNFHIKLRLLASNVEDTFTYPYYKTLKT